MFDRRLAKDAGKMSPTVVAPRSSWLTSLLARMAQMPRLLASGDLGDMLTDINTVVVPLSKPSMYATIAALRDDGSGALEVTTAGHLPVLHYRAAAQRMDRLSLPQIPIGMFDERTYTSRRVEVATGDLFAIVPDGLTEVFDAEDREFGLDRLADAIPFVPISRCSRSRRRYWAKCADTARSWTTRRCSWYGSSEV